MSTMSVNSFVGAAKLLCATSQKPSILLRAETGVGKSQIVHQIGAHFNLPVIDRRLSQLTEGDIIGLPSTDGNVTRFNPPDWYKQCCDKPHVLFLDELNRATQEVLQAAFQIALDRELNGWKLHPETLIFSAINVGTEYTVNELDPALLRRWWVVDLEPTLEDWVIWARGAGVNTLIIDFLTSSPKWLDRPKDCEPNSVQPTRHSWERLSKALAETGLGDDEENNLFYTVCQGFLGNEATHVFVDFYRNNNIRVTGDEVINHWSDKVAKKVVRTRLDARAGICESVVEAIHAATKTKGGVSDAQLAALEKFVTLKTSKGERVITAELVTSLWTGIVGFVKTILADEKSSHKTNAVNIFSRIPAAVMAEIGGVYGIESTSSKKAAPAEEPTPTKKTRKAK